jgi:hypothetical protein
MGVWGRSPHLLDPFPKPGSSVRPPRSFPKNSVPRAGNPGKRPVKLSDFSKKIRESYGTFRKKLTRVIGLSQKSLLKFADFLENMWGQNAPPHVRSFRSLCQTFQKKVGKVTGYFRKSSPRSSNFSKIVRQRYQNFRKSGKIPVNILSGQRGKRDAFPTLSCVQVWYILTLIRAQYGLRLSFFRSKRSPYRAPFKNKSK